MTGPLRLGGGRSGPEFRVNVSFVSLYGGSGWRVCIERVADGKVLEREFSLRWRAMRFARSAKRLRRWFARHERRTAYMSVSFEVGPS